MITIQWNWKYKRPLWNRNWIKDCCFYCISAVFISRSRRQVNPQRKDPVIPRQLNSVYPNMTPSNGSGPNNPSTLRLINPSISVPPNSQAPVRPSNQTLIRPNNPTSSLSSSVSSSANSDSSPQQDGARRAASLANESECVMCSDARVETIFRPCGHAIACQSCSLRMKKCPTCRTVISEKIPA